MIPRDNLDEYEAGGKQDGMVGDVRQPHLPHLLVDPLLGGELVLAETLYRGAI